LQSGQAAGGFDVSTGLVQFPSIILGMLKHPALLGGFIEFNKEVDRRNYWRIKLMGSPVDQTIQHFVPYLFVLHNMVRDGTGVVDENGNFYYPEVNHYILDISPHHALY
jgi:hypothetical protein